MLLLHDLGIMTGYDSLRFPLDVRFGVPHVVRTANDQRHPLMQFLRLDVQDAGHSGAGSSAGLFDDHRHRIGLVQQRSLPSGFSTSPGYK